MKNKEIILSKEQQEIVKLSTGQHLVLAPPGTGKTELLAHRVELALKRGIDANDMICLTFTNRAAKSMRDRIEQKYPDNQLFIGNIHNFCSNFLFGNKLVPIFSSVIDEGETNLLLEEAKSIEGYNVDGNNINITLLKLNSLQKQKRLKFPENILMYVDKDIPNYELALKVCRRYEELKEESALIDFDDLLTLTYHNLIQNNNELIKYSWIQVDEVQDINPIQWEIIKLISSKDAHKVYFGDYEQAIFSFLGAKLERLHSIEKECKVHNLQKNFRSPAYLLKVFVDYAKTHLEPKWKKDPIPEKDYSKSKEDLLLAEVKGNQCNEAKFIIEEILPKYVEDGVQTAILVRTNKSADFFSNKLKSHNIEHFKVSGFDLFNIKVIKDIIAFLSCLYNEFDRVSWFRVLNIFGNTKTLKKSRQLVNSLFEVGLIPTDYLENQSKQKFDLEKFLEVIKNERVVVFDTETTGLNFRTDDIIQIAAVEIIKGKIGNTFEVYLKSDKLNEDAEAIHKISSKLLDKKGVTPKEGLKRFFEFVAGDSLLAHNLKFDLKFLISYSERNNFDVKSLVEKNNFDSLEITRKLFPKLNSYSLSDLLNEFKVKGINSHNALDDAIATASLIKHLINKTEEKIILQKEFVEKNSRALNKFYKEFYPIWNKWKMQMNSHTSFENVIKDFLDYIIENLNYEFNNDDEVYLSKLLRHMKIKCGTNKLYNLLARHISEYKSYKESDLIIGDEKIVISTIHKAKGLEFENVIIPECVEGVFPSWASKDQEAIKEDARTLYVALSRAMRRIIITSHTDFKSQNDNIFPRRRSSLIDSIEKHFNKVFV